MSEEHCNGSKPSEVDQKIRLITRNLEEVLGYERIRPIVEKRSFRIYWGSATTGKPHIAYFVPLLKVADFLSADCEVTILLADLHAYLDNMKAPWELLELRTRYYKELISTMLRSLNIPLEKLRFVRGTEFQLSKEYMLDVYKLATVSTLHDCKKAGSDVVKQVEHPLLSAFLYPGLQSLDEEYLKVDAQFGGLDQRKIFTYAEKILPALGYKKRIHLMNPMVSGLSGGKMSSSEADTKIDMLDSSGELKKKMTKAFCEEGNIERNGILAFCNFIIFPVMKKKQDSFQFIIDRKEEHGGRITAASYSDLEALFAEKKLHPQDLKKAALSYVNEILAPIRQHFESPEMKKLVAEAYPPPSKVSEDVNSTRMLCMKVGLVKAVYQHPSLAKFRVFDLQLSGTETIQVCDSLSGSLDQSMVGTSVVVVTNLLPTKIDSIRSTGLLLMIKHQKMGESQPNLQLFQAPQTDLGESVFFSNYPIDGTETFPKLSLKKSTLASLQENVSVNDEGLLEYLNGYLVTRKGPIATQLRYGMLVFTSPV